MDDEPVTIVDREVLKVLSADTRMDILKALSEGRRMPSFVARKLGKSDATIVEHLKALEHAGLVHKTSAPGKKWVFYSLTESGESIVGGKSKKLVIIIALSLMVVLAGSAMFSQYRGYTGLEGLKMFSSYSELDAFVKSGYESYGVFRGAVSEPGAFTTQAETAGATAGAESKAADYSLTNVQVQGVDEADIVKSDGKYLYVAPSYGDSIAIIDAYPATEARIVSNFTVNGSVAGLFISGDRLVVISTSYDYDVKPLIGITAPRRTSATSTVISTYDVSDRSNPKLVKESSAEGYYYDSRMIGDYVYAIAQMSVYYDGGQIPMPVVRTAGLERTVAAREIYYSPYPDSSYVFTTVLAENVQDASAAASTKTFLLGDSESMYVSQGNIYLASQKRMAYKDVFERIVDDAIIPSVPADVQAKIIRVRDSDETIYEKESEIQEALQDYYATLDPEEGVAVVKDLQERYEKVYEEIAKDYERTVVHRIAIGSGGIDYAASGEVPGTVLNQFSMDEDAHGYFRIATTSGQWIGTGNTVNNMYVLDPALNVVGRLEDLAPGERIYAVRFIGSRAYMVTFRQVDPLFVIDLSDPHAPAVLGFLKVPGVSDYLHPYDDTHVIGVGRDADAEGRVRGVKLSLFDATDVTNPTEISKYVVEGGWSWSEASYEHKAFLFNRDKELLVIPIQLTEGGIGEWRSWQGVYVFKLNLQEGFVLKGSVTHVNETAADEGKYYYDYGAQIHRSLYMDNILYTVSGIMVKANDLASLAEISKIDLPGFEYGPMYRMPIAESAI